MGLLALLNRLRCGTGAYIPPGLHLYDRNGPFPRGRSEGEGWLISVKIQVKNHVFLGENGWFQHSTRCQHAMRENPMGGALAEFQFNYQEEKPEVQVVKSGRGGREEGIRMVEEMEAGREGEREIER